MSDYSALYITATGEIVEVAETANLSAPDGTQSVYAGNADPETEYILAGVLTDRPTVTTQFNYTIEPDGSDSVSISLPAGTIVTDVESSTSQTAASADTLVFTSTTTGIFGVFIDAPFPYRDALITITVSTKKAAV